MKKEPIDFNDFYNQYNKLVYTVALHYMQNVENAQEITQDVFVQSYQSLHKFNQKSSLKTWVYRIYRIAINRCSDNSVHKIIID